MLNVVPKLLGLAEAEILGAEPELLLDRCAGRGLPLMAIRRVDGCTVKVRLWERDLPALRELAEACGCELGRLRLRGGSRGRARLWARRFLLLGLGLMAALLLCSSLFVWEIEVRGCDRLTEGQVLRALADCGVERGTYWPGISQELVRGQMLSKLPELAWMTVNLSGSRAIVLVSERQEKPELRQEDVPADIVAACPGIVRSVTVLNGRCLVAPGDAVLAGEILVTGAGESLTGPPHPQRAMAEIQAETWHELTAVCPLEALQNCDEGRVHSRFALQIGRNRLNLGAFSQKGLDECDKIVHEYTVGIKGLFALPLTLVREVFRARTETGTETDRAAEMEAALQKRLETQIDGEILSASFSVSRTDGLLVVTLRANCLENIAQTAEYPLP